MGDSILDPELEGKLVVMPPSEEGAAERRSRLVVLPDGTTMPVLLVLARAAFGEWDGTTVQPEWADGDWRNERQENVVLRPVRIEPYKVRSAYGKAGTTEYRKAWRAAHPEAVKAAQAKAYAKRKALIAKGKAVEAIAGGLGGAELVADLAVREVEEERRDELLEKLERVLGPSDGQDPEGPAQAR